MRTRRNKFLAFATGVFFLVSANTVSAQNFLGKKHIFVGDVSLNLPMMNSPLGVLHLDANYEYAVLPPSIGIEYAIAIGDRTSFSINTSWKGLQNVSVSNRYFGGSNEEYYFSFEDVYKLRTNNLRFGLSFKKYFEYAPVGRYFSFGGGINLTNAIVYLTNIEKRTEAYSNFKDHIYTRYEPTKRSYVPGFLTLGIGKSKLLSPSTILDYGVKSSFVIGAYDFNRSPSHDQGWVNSKTESIFNYLTTVNLQSTYLIEFYVQFGICK